MTFQSEDLDMAPFIRTICLCLGLVMAILIGPVAYAGSVATAVIPVTVTGEGAPFTIVPEAETGAVTEVKISFDLSAVPQGAQLTSAVLRLVPVNIGTNTQFLRIFKADAPDTSIGGMNVSTAAAPVVSTGNGLVTALADRPTSLDIILKTDSVRSKRQYYSFADSDASNRPRLIVTWSDTSPQMTRTGTQLRYRGSPDDATPWVYNAPKGAVLSGLFPAAGTQATVLTGPAFVGDLVVFMAKDGSGTKLWGMSADGGVAWSYAGGDQPLADTTWKYLRLDDQGRLMAFANNGSITVFTGFGPDGPTKHETKAVPEVNVSKRPVISAGGMIMLRKNQSSEGEGGNYIYALSPLPDLRVLWRSPASVGNASAPVLSPRLGQQLVYVMGEGQSKGLSIFDNTTGTQPVPTGFPAGSKLGNFADFHPPLAVVIDPKADTPADIVYLSGFDAGAGTLDGFYDLDKPGTPGRWNQAKNGPVSRCISPPPADGAAAVVYCVQASEFRAFEYQTGKQICASDPSVGPISATSNIVADGSGSLFFWQENAGTSGVLRGFSPTCETLFTQPLDGLPAKNDGIEVLDLRAGADGVIYAYSGSEVFALRVTQAAGNPTELVGNTQYTAQGDMTLAALTAPANAAVSLHAEGALALGDLKVPATAAVTCSARKGLSFGVNFSLEVGATLNCGIDTTTAKPAP